MIVYEVNILCQMENKMLMATFLIDGNRPNLFTSTDKDWHKNRVKCHVANQVPFAKCYCYREELCPPLFQLDTSILWNLT